jgi:hypothetical protein
VAIRAVVTAAVVTADVIVTAAVVTVSVVTAAVVTVAVLTAAVVTAAVVTAAVVGSTTAVVYVACIFRAAVATAGVIVTCAAIYYAVVVFNVDSAIVTFAAIDKAEVIVTFPTANAIWVAVAAVTVATIVVVCFHRRSLWQLLLHYFCLLYPIHAGSILYDLNNGIFCCALSMRNCLQQPLLHTILAVRRRLISRASCHRRIMPPMD